MKNYLSKSILILSDILTIFISTILAFYTRDILSPIINTPFNQSSNNYFDFYILNIFIVTIFVYEGIYNKRFDFWHESKHIIKSLIFSFLLVMAYLAITKSIEEFSRLFIFFIFLYLTIFIPLEKLIIKNILFKISLWQREAKIYGDDTFLQKEIFTNSYIGYCESKDNNTKTVFINAQKLNPKELKSILDKEIETREEVIFIPTIEGYDLSQSFIYSLSNSRTNLIEIKNKLKSKYRLALQQIFNYLLAILLLPILLPIIAILAFLIKKESPGPIFFAHYRVGKGGKLIPTLKFRSMYSDAKERLDKLLEDDKIREEWENNFKLKDDPRVTKIGAILRKTSLDELPQIFNVLKGEMNFVGPRPVVQQEIEQYYKSDAGYYLMVNPGITGLWQVSGRSDTDYEFRVKSDKWYVSNWSLWLDIVILFKTVKVVIKRDGAY